MLGLNFADSLLIFNYSVDIHPLWWRRPQLLPTACWLLSLMAITERAALWLVWQRKRNNAVARGVTYCIVCVFINIYQQNIPCNIPFCPRLAKNGLAHLAFARFDRWPGPVLLRASDDPRVMDRPSQMFSPLKYITFAEQKKTCSPQLLTWVCLFSQSG